MCQAVVSMLLMLVACSWLAAQEAEPAADEGRPDPIDTPLPSVAARVDGLEHLDGLLSLHLDRDRGRLWLELPPPQGPDGEVGRYLYVESLRTGLGSNPVGLDRGQLGDEQLVRVRRLGPKVLLEQVNLAFRALSDDVDERRAVEESFATSVLWGGEIAALDPDGRALVDIASFVVRDAHDVEATLRRTKRGEYALDADRSALDLGSCLVFPDNVELEAILTFGRSKPGDLAADTAPTPDAITLVQHHSFIRLPDDGYRPRRFDPRMASNAIEFADYAAPLDAPLERRWIRRHRVEKTDPAATRSRVVEPIVYYVDRGAPEPVRSALVEGAGWWAEAFERAGFIDAYRVELMPEDAHPLDVRYNVIQWVHRSTRGWSYGGSVVDPRTGEIIKGHVTLGSLRVRQDRLIFEGLAGADRTGRGGPDDPIQLSLARLRQLSAHEVGHTLGFSHNFAASTYGDRASVMDYPAPLVTLTADGSLDFSRAYGVGIGEWDVHAVRYAYAHFPPDQDDEAALERIVRDGLERGLLFVSDADARPAGSAHPLAHLWDNGADPVDALRETMAVRRVALTRFGEASIRPGLPLSLLQETFAPVYLYHRYQVEAASKLVGGLDYAYVVRGDGQPPARPVDDTRQRAALDTLLSCLEPEALRIADRTIAVLVPRPFGYGRGRELFEGSTDPVFDGRAAETTAADMVVSMLLEPHRAARLVQRRERDPGRLGLGETIDGLVESAFAASPARADTPTRRRVGQAVVERLVELAEDDDVPPTVRAIVDARLAALATRLQSSDVDPHGRDLAAQIRRHLERVVSGSRPERRIDPPPPGSPIGSVPGWGECCGG